MGMYHHAWFYVLLGTDLRVLCVLGKHCTNWDLLKTERMAFASFGLG